MIKNAFNLLASSNPKAECPGRNLKIRNNFRWWMNLKNVIHFSFSFQITKCPISFHFRFISPTASPYLWCPSKRRSFHHPFSYVFKPDPILFAFIRHNFPFAMLLLFLFWHLLQKHLSLYLNKLVPIHSPFPCYFLINLFQSFAPIASFSFISPKGISNTNYFVNAWKTMFLCFAFISL